MDELFAGLMQITHGFKPIEKAAESLSAARSAEEIRTFALPLLAHQAYQIRSLGIFLLGRIAARDPEVLRILRVQVSQDPSWQVQEILAKAFDQYCRDNGYARSLGTIVDWLQDPDPRVCRAVTEGLRIWTSREFFRDRPVVAIRLIAMHRSSESEYLRKSVGNALRDISRSFPEQVAAELSTWDLSNKRQAFTHRYATQKKSSNP
ncbi:MAG: DNA alkylation repair protein [Marinilabiliales bacterium]|nr:DNA alkylation repair protein [Marinilabiliales bacterium]